MTSFVLFNLIIGLAITDVNELHDEAESLDLKYKAKRFIKTSEKIKGIYRSDEQVLQKMIIIISFDLIKLHSRKGKFKIDDLVWWKRWSAKVMRQLLRRHCYLHKLDHIFVDMKSLEVAVEVSRQFVNTLTNSIGFKSKFVMDTRTYGKVQEILKKTYEQSSFNQ